jgi:hypothetical protein
MPRTEFNWAAVDRGARRRRPQQRKQSKVRNVKQSSEVMLFTELIKLMIELHVEGAMWGTKKGASGDHGDADRNPVNKANKVIIVR